jgi:mRNA-degrading endonuclease RelE of RelBE toxin-antitoxin system
MSYSIKTLVPFEKQAKRLIKKYPSLKAEVSELIHSLSENPKQGTPIGNNCFKIHVAIGSKGKGKYGGARVITHLVVKESVVYLISMYDKSEMPSISGKEIEELLKQIR